LISDVAFLDAASHIYSKDVRCAFQNSAIALIATYKEIKKRNKQWTNKAIFLEL
jgi:hypothetical protein